MTEQEKDLRANLGRQLARRHRFRPAGPVGLLVTGGTVGLLFVVPLLIGAYGGRWLDDRFPGYSVHWTVSLILLGIGVGAWNVYRFIKELDS